MARLGDTGEDLVGHLVPHARSGPLVRQLGVAGDHCLQVARAAVHAVPCVLIGTSFEPTPHEVDARGAGQVDQQRLVRRENRTHRERCGRGELLPTSSSRFTA